MTVNLKSFEISSVSGSPLAGLLVQLFAASDTQPNTGTVLQSTTTDANGMWQFTGLANGVYDVKVTAPGINQVKWYKGNSKLSLAELNTVFGGSIVDGTVVPADINAGGAANMVLATVDGVNTAFQKVVSGMIGANAVTQSQMVYGSSGDASISSTSYFDLAEMQATLTMTGGDLIAWFSGTFAHATPGNAGFVAFKLDSGSEVGEQICYTDTSGYSKVVSCLYKWTALSGVHTVYGRYKTTGGTFTSQNSRRQMLIMELKR